MHIHTYIYNLHNQICKKYANMQEICINMQIRKCNTCALQASMYQNMQNTNMLNVQLFIYAKNMHKYAKLNIGKYAFFKI